MAGNSKFPFDNLPPEMQAMIISYTWTSFAVESAFKMRLRLGAASWTDVPYLIRYDLQLPPRCLRKPPEMNVRLTRYLNPAFKHSRLFEESDASIQEMLENNSKQTTFLSICAVRLEMRRHAEGPFEFLQFESRTHVFRTPYWSRIERSAIEDVRKQCRATIYMEFEE